VTSKNTQPSQYANRVPKNNFHITIENVVATAELHQNVDLESIKRSFPTAKYDPNTFPGLIYHTRKPDVTVLMFSSGKMVVAGAKSERMVSRAVYKLIDELKTAGLVILGEPDTVIRNVVASADLCRQIDLEDMATKLEGTIYDPEQFPGLIYRQKDTKGVLLIFANGRLVCSGARSLADVEKAINQLCKTLETNDLMLRDNPLQTEATRHIKPSQPTRLVSDLDMKEELEALQQYT
jgi:transcription initiation factor TFIID TATA-box-binding protein